MSSIATERLINRARYIFIVFFLLASVSAYMSGSSIMSWGAILLTDAIFLTLAIINQVFIARNILSQKLIYISVTIEFLLIFSLKFLMHFDPKVGYGLTIKEPATFLVYFLFMIITALRYNKKLNLYAGSLAISTYIALLLLAIFHGGMRFTRDVGEFFQIDTLRASAELPKILFLAGFTYFIYRMAEFTSENMDQLQEAEENTRDNFIHMRSLMEAVESTSRELLEGSNGLTGASEGISDIITRFGHLMEEVEIITGNISQSIDQVRSRSDFQYNTVEANFEKISEIATLMKDIFQKSSEQSKQAHQALQLARSNEEGLKKTLTAINSMKKNSQKIEEISHTISEIADQTSLLSLNAAIESARAGDHGKGFAVVADEISKLASMSIDSSKEITFIINDTVGNIENVSKLIENLSSYLGETINFVKINSEFMQSLRDDTERELRESQVLYDTNQEVESAARRVIEEADIQEEAITQVLKWFSQANAFGKELTGNIRDLQSLSRSLEGRSEELSSLIKEADSMENN